MTTTYDLPDTTEAHKALRRYRAYNRHLDHLYSKVSNHPYPDDDEDVVAWRATHSHWVMDDLATAIIELLAVVES